MEWLQVLMDRANVRFQIGFLTEMLVTDSAVKWLLSIVN